MGNGDSGKTWVLEAGGICSFADTGESAEKRLVCGMEGCGDGCICKEFPVTLIWLFLFHLVHRVLFSSEITGDCFNGDEEFVSCK